MGIYGDWLGFIGYYGDMWGIEWDLWGL